MAPPWFLVDEALYNNGKTYQYKIYHHTGSNFIYKLVILLLLLLHLRLLI